MEVANGPKREYRQLTSGAFVVKVTPPEWSGFSASEIILNADQFKRYERWLSGGGLIQEMLPELSAEQREILQSGISPREWAQMGGES